MGYLFSVWFQKISIQKRLENPRRRRGGGGSFKAMYGAKSEFPEGCVCVCVCVGVS